MWFNQQTPMHAQQAPTMQGQAGDDQKRKMMAQAMMQMGSAGNNGSKGGIAASALAGALAGYMQRKPGMNYDPMSGTNGILMGNRGSGD